MPIIPITNLGDPRIEPYRNLKATNATRRQHLLVAEGDKLTERVIKAGLEIHSLLLVERYLSAFAPLAGPEVPLYVVPEADIDRIVGFNFHRGVLACARRPASAELSELVQTAGGTTLVACPEVHDPENLGAILRISAAFGVPGIALGRDCCDPYSRRVLRVSMGAAVQLPIARYDDLAAELAHLRESSGLELWATVTDRSAEPFDAINRPEKLALVLGSEGHGLSDAWQRLADRRVTIPMPSMTDSLNVAVATGVLLYHLSR